MRSDSTPTSDDRCVTPRVHDVLTWLTLELREDCGSWQREPGHQSGDVGVDQPCELLAIAPGEWAHLGHWDASLIGPGDRRTDQRRTPLPVRHDATIDSPRAHPRSRRSRIGVSSGRTKRFICAHWTRRAGVLPQLRQPRAGWFVIARCPAKITSFMMVEGAWSGRPRRSCRRSWRRRGRTGGSV